MDKKSTDYEISRRSFLSYVTAAMGAFAATVIAVPLVGAFVSPALRKRLPGIWMSLGPVSSFRKGDPKMVGLTVIKQDGWVEARQPRLVWVVTEDNNKFRIYNAQCTHLGCIVDWHPEKKAWMSPCHAGVFAFEDGQVLSGPPPRPLDSLEYKIEKGELVINFQDFHLGTTDKKPI